MESPPFQRLPQERKKRRASPETAGRDAQNPPKVPRGYDPP
jgi:hypothetical protein